ncbi:MAG: cytochrome c3 family protein [bacterium]
MNNSLKDRRNLKDRLNYRDFFTRRKQHILILGAGIVCGVLSLWVLNNYVLDRPSFCITCHMIKSANDTWQKAKHKPEYTKNSCNACHVEPGLTGSIKASIYGLENVYVFLFGPGEDDIKASRPVYCTQKGCHDRMEKSMLGKNIRVNHGMHMKQGYACVICHDRVAHEEFAMVSNLSMMKDFCFACHNDEVAPRKDCSVCHVYQDRMMKGTETPDNLVGIISPHVQPDEVTCQNCHVDLEESPQKSCINCHDETVLPQYRQDKADFNQRLAKVKAQIDEIQDLLAKIKKAEPEKWAGSGNLGSSAGNTGSSGGNPGSSGENPGNAGGNIGNPGQNAQSSAESGGPDPAWNQTLSLLQTVQKNYTYLIQDNSQGAHNRKLAAAILSKLEDDVQRVRYFMYGYQRL